MGIYPRLSVRENLAYFGMLRGMPPAVLSERVSQVLATLGLEAIADRRTAGFSQGERMKTALGRAVLHALKNLLLDEPTSGLVAAFVGGKNVAMDTVAGERERQSLLPLLMNPVRRREIVLGKWLAVALFSAAGLILNLAGFAIVFARAGIHAPVGWPRFLLALAAGVLPLALLAASLQLLISTVCRAAKEAQTYLSMLVFLPMGLGMFQVFFPAAAFGPAAALGCFTAAMALLVLEVAANRLHRDEIVYGN